MIRCGTCAAVGWVEVAELDRKNGLPLGLILNAVGDAIIKVVSFRERKLTGTSG